MAQVKELFGTPKRGRLAGATYYSRNKKMYIRPSENLTSKDRKPTENEMRTRTQLVNVGRLWTRFDGELKPTFESKLPGETDYSAFLRLNHSRSRVFLSK